MKKFFGLMLCAAALTSFIACDNNAGSNDDTPALVTSNIYALNNGSYYGNNASLTSYNLEDKSVVADIFLTANGQGLGDTAQDILQFEDKLYITVYGSGVIFVTEIDGTIVATIEDDEYSAPRCLATDGEYVYVTYYDGAVAKIDTATDKIVAKAEVAINPETVAVANGNLYIAISQGYGNTNACNTIDVYNADKMTKSKSIEVLLNPTTVVADSKGNLYVLSMGDYGSTTVQTIQKIDAKSGEVTVIDVESAESTLPSAIAMGKDDILYAFEGVIKSDGYSYEDGTLTIYAYNTATDKSTKFITDDTTISNLYSLCANQYNGDVYVGSSDYVNNGDVYVFNAEGKLQYNFEAGMNPIKFVAITAEEE